MLSNNLSRHKKIQYIAI